MNSDQVQQWELAIQAVLEALERNETFGESKKLPKDGKAVKCKWVFKTKLDTNGNHLIKHKARLVAKGYTQLDYSAREQYDQSSIPWGIPSLVVH